MMQKDLSHIITELQGLEGTSRDHQVQPPAKQVPSLQQVAQESIQMSSEYLQGRRLLHLLFRADTPGALPHVQMELPMF